MLKFNKFISITLIFIIMSYVFFSLINCNSYAANQTISTDIDKISESKYPGVKKLIKTLQSSHPNWKFKVLYTGLDWNTVIANEYMGHGKSPKNLVPGSNSNYSGDWICSICGNKAYDNGGWVCASESAIKYMMDPRNSINETDIFQFQELTYDGYDENTIAKMVEGTFLNKAKYINAIKEVAEETDVSPYYLVARILQEQGKSGTVLTKGKGYEGQYEGYYNVFNIGANGGTKAKIILNGLKKAKKEGWTSLVKAIKGGTKFIAKDYIAKGQNTLYFQKFDVESSDNSLYYHQYMQNILAAQKEGETLRKTYNEVDSLDGKYTFIIPLYDNMPSVVSKRPSTTSTSNVSTDIVKVNVNTRITLRKSENGTATGEFLYKDEIVTRIEKATEKVNGTYWDKVIKSNGVTGYVARQTYDDEEYKLYLVPINSENNNDNNNTNNNSNDNTNNNNSNNNLSSDKVKIKDQVVVITPSAKVSDIKKVLGNNIVIKDLNGKELSNSAVAGTGCRIDDKYTVAMLGDINGDGEVKSTDYMLIKNYIMGKTKFKVSQKIAADLNKDEEVKATDYMLVKNYIMGTSKITLK